MTKNSTLLGLLLVLGLWGSPKLYGYQLSGPTMGYVADPVTATLRVINGIPGASTVGESVTLDRKIRGARVAVKQDYALAVTEDNSEVVVISDLSGERSLSGAAGVYPGGDALALAPNGSSAVIYSFAMARLQVVGGLPSELLVNYEVDTTGMGSLSAVAVADDARVLAAFSNGETGALYLFAADRAPVLIATVGNVSGIAFDASGERAVIADRGRNEAFLFQDLSLSPIPIRLANDVDGISDPVGVLLSRDAARVYIANAGSGTVSVLNVAGGEAQHFSCNCRPTTMEWLQSGTLVALTHNTDQPIFLFDLESTDGRFLVIPPRIPNDR
jgi:DNA-binding beta-propeller fold protein YncE